MKSIQALFLISFIVFSCAIPRCGKNQILRTPPLCFATCKASETRCYGWAPSCKRCYCKNGYVLENVNSNDCILAEDCKCQPNEVIDFVKGEYYCDGMHGDICLHETGCAKSCVCPEGYARLNNMTCVHKSQCPELSHSYDLSSSTSSE